MGLLSKLKKKARRGFKQAGASVRRGFKQATKAVTTDVGNVARGIVKDPKSALMTGLDTIQAVKGAVIGGRSVSQTKKAFGNIGKGLDKLSRKGGGRRTLEIGRLGEQAKSRAKQKVHQWKTKAGAVEQQARSRYQEGKKHYQKFKRGGYGIKGKLGRRNFLDGRMGSPPAYAARRHYKAPTRMGTTPGSRGPPRRGRNLGSFSGERV